MDWKPISLNVLSLIRNFMKKRCPYCSRNISLRYNLNSELVFIAHKDKEGNTCNGSDKKAG